MSRRKGSISRRIDEDFNRNSKLLMTREVSPNTNSERQLFDPRSDHPIAFNKSNTVTISKRDETFKRKTPPPPPGKRRPTPAPGRKLWSANDQNIQPCVETPKPTTPVPSKKPPLDTMKKSITTPLLTEQEQQRKKWKSLVASLKSIESKLEILSTTSRTLSCFNDDIPSHQINRRHTMDQLIDTQDTILVEQDVLDAEKIWKEKIQLHLSLAEKYLEILNCDLDYAEKKGLESLCWKRAVYSLVDQFRRALKKSAATTTQAAAAATTTKRSELAAMLLDEGVLDVTEIPVINPSRGMTLIKIKQDMTTQDQSLFIQQTKMILTLFLEYLDLVDTFYQKLTLFLKSVDDDHEEESDMENYLKQWRRTRKYKWYTCIPLRGDIARYRWSYIPDDNQVVNYHDMVAPVTQWTKTEAFKEAWKRYFLGIWLMPAKGNLYFNLSLLLVQQTPGHDFHKLYLSIRSLMVRRNGFLNARESMLVLFESNRRWIQKNLEFGSKHKKQGKKKLSTINNTSDKNTAIPALFVRLHGMLFTKIGLDEFSKIKRLFFDALFEKNHCQDKPPPRMENDHKQLSASHFFWFETIVLCLSSLYTYDYANSKLTKLISSHSTKLFYPDNTKDEHYQILLDDLGDSLLFTFEIDLTCQIAVQLFQTYLDPLLPCPTIPLLPALPHVALTLKDNQEFLFGQDTSCEQDTLEDTDTHAWLVYIEILLHWMVLNGICIRSKDRVSLWESLVGDIGYDLVSQRYDTYHRSSKISSAFWPLLLKFLNTLLSGLPEEDKYDMVNKHLMDDDDKSTASDNKFSDLEYAFAKNISTVLGQEPDLPEEDYLRGLGWVDEIHGRFLKLEEQEVNKKKGENHNKLLHSKFDTAMRRKLKILDYGFTLVKHLDDILYYDPVEEIFTTSKTVEERAFALDQDANLAQSLKNHDAEHLLSDQEDHDVTPPVTIAEMDDDVLLSSETECSDEKNEGDDIMTQLKKRREQLQSIVASAEQEERFGYRRLPARAKEREARLNYLRQCIIPGKTILVLDTNCFIGHFDHVKKLLQAKTWSIIVPLVVVTELDGLRTNPQRLGLVAQQGIELLESTLAANPKQSTSLRIQTSHHNFMNDISIRTEQFVFGETDRNLDDLILSSCLWWISQVSHRDDQPATVCLVTGDRNLSVKARARDVEVVPVSAIIQLTP